ncbi:pyridoxal phosphate-dependent serine/threonine dehydratase protein [Rhizobium etli 8C-3]|uniref:Pyridoxal phosphate-dependent serine/threonine dehydratase protein n=2 Tax=Rhizobium TaxID=379 RepID=A0A1L5NZ69_RHIET|nr:MULTISPECIES: threonine/serine dehydratase [Rhizobium]APO73213.1 pyridoxal phosphate-dependent serine/threonine dehydratase protein [Rhizobium etli 8C-3]TCU38598.1 L-threonine ammonia-lyase [Rhizobium azibense]
MPNALSAERIAEIEGLIRPYIRRTPMMSVDMQDFGGAPFKVDLKLECLQHSGSFKARGAFSHLLTRQVPAAGIVAASGGNHGAAVAYAASRLGVPATIFVPAVTSPAKAQKIRAYGASLVIGGERYSDALAASETHERATGALAVHAYDQVETLLGQATLGKEIEEDMPAMTTLLVAVGGGGLVGGIAAWFGGRVKIVAVESDGAPTLYEAFRAGRPVDAPAGGIAADSLAPKRVGELMFPLAQQFVQPPVLVTDDEIRTAQKALWEGARVVAEPGGAAAFAAALSGKYVPARNERVCVLVCGANTTAVKFD